MPTPPRKRKTAAARELLQSVVTLKPETWLDTTKTSPDADAGSLMQQLLERVSEQSGLRPERVQLFPNIGAFSISADRSFIEQLTKEPEVLHSTPNLRDEPMMIEPVRKRRVGYGQRSSKKK